MRYVAVFTLFSLPVAKGFSSFDKANACLLEADLDLDSSPLGLYDVLLNKVIPYQSAGKIPIEIDETLIARLAKDHVERVV